MNISTISEPLFWYSSTLLQSFRDVLIALLKNVLQIVQKCARFTLAVLAHFSFTLGVQFYVIQTLKPYYNNIRLCIEMSFTFTEVILQSVSTTFKRGSRKKCCLHLKMCNAWLVVLQFLLQISERRVFQVQSILQNVSRKRLPKMFHLFQPSIKGLPSKL